MIHFTDPRLYVKGTCEAIATNPATGDIEYFSSKFQTANITTSVTMGEIRAGLGNAVAAIIPSDSTLNVDFTAADFNLWAKTAQLGGTLRYNAPVMVCQNVTATTTALTLDVTGGAPVAQIGFAEPKCYVQIVNQAAPIATTGEAYDINGEGVVQGFTATAGTKYKVWYFVNKASAQIATVSALFDPKVVHFTAQIAVYANNGGAANEGTRVGWLYVIVPALKLGGNGGIVGDQTTNDTTSMSGQAVVYDNTVIGEECDLCGGAGNALAHYIYVPDDEVSAINGLAVIGGIVDVPTGTTAQLPVKFVMADGSLVTPPSYAEGFTYELGEDAPAGTAISAAGVITAGSTAGDTTATVTYTAGDKTFVVYATVSVYSPD